MRLAPTDYSSDPGQSTTNDNDASDGSSEDGLQSLPAGLVPLVATQMHTYQDCLKQVVREANKVYTEFRLSEEGQNFQGQVRQWYRMGGVNACLCVFLVWLLRALAT